MKVKKLLEMPKELWDQIEEYRFAARFKTESEAMRNLLGLGLAKNRETLEALKKGKKR